MIPLLLAAVTLLPLTGLWLVERGAFGVNIGQGGHPNGASAAFMMHAVLFAATVLATRRACGRTTGQAASPVLSNSRFRRLALLACAVITSYTLFLVGIVGAGRVLGGEIDKGVFRSQLGSFGVVAFMARDFVLPTLAAVCAAVYLQTRRRATDSVLMAAVAVAAAGSTAVWGYKAGALLTVLPSLILLVPRVRLVPLLATAVLGASSTIAFAIAFDRVTPGVAVTYVAARATVGAADTAWRVWDWQVTGTPFPPWAPTLAAGLGGRVAAFLEVFSRSDEASYVGVDFSAVLTNIAKGYAPDIDFAASNVTGTVFAEGVIALGAPGFLVFSVLAGLVTGVVWAVVDHARSRRLPLTAALAAVYFQTSVFTWLNSGGVTTLISVPAVVSYAVAATAGAAALRWSGIRLRPIPEPRETA